MIKIIDNKSLARISYEALEHRLEMGEDTDTIQDAMDYFRPEYVAGLQEDLELLIDQKTKADRIGAEEFNHYFDGLIDYLSCRIETIEEMWI